MGQEITSNCARQPNRPRPEHGSDWSLESCCPVRTAPGTDNTKWNTIAQWDLGFAWSMRAKRPGANMSSQYVEILLVEDNPNDAELSLYALKKHHVANRVHLARDGADALDFLFAEGAYHDRSVEDTPKVILLDLKLPKIDGLAVLRRVKEDPRTRQVPVVVLR